MRNDEQAATKAASALFAEPEQTEETEEVTEQGAEEAASEGTSTETTEEPLFPEFDVELPEDLQQELEEPTTAEILAELEEDEEYQLLDEDQQKLMQRALAAEKKAAYYEALRVQESKKSWAEEAKKFFPLSEPFLNELGATSRKGFLREAKARHESVLPLLKPLKERAEAEIKATRDKVEAEVRAEAEERWGKPPESKAEPTEATITADELARNRAKGDLTSTLRSMMFPKRGE